MTNCSVCGGEGFRRSTDPEEEVRGIQDPCYHCGTTGEELAGRPVCVYVEQVSL